MRKSPELHHERFTASQTEDLSLSQHLRFEPSQREGFTLQCEKFKPIHHDEVSNDTGEGIQILTA